MAAVEETNFSSVIPPLQAEETAKKDEEAQPKQKSTKARKMSVPTPKKVKKVAAPKKRGPSTHPPYFEMIEKAIVTLKDRTGSSQYAITAFIENSVKTLPPNFRKLLLVQLKKFVASGKLVKVKNSYKLPSARASKPAAASADVKPNAKPKAKAAAEKKVTVNKAKPKAKTARPAVKAKPAAAKPNAAPKRKVASVKKSAAAKVAKTSTRSTPRKAVAKKAAVSKKAAPVKKATPVKRKTVKSPAKAKAVAAKKKVKK